jgi:hypothetical protein
LAPEVRGEVVPARPGRDTQIHQQVADLLHGPGTVRVGGDTENVHVTAADLDHEQAVQLLEGHCAVHVEEIDRLPSLPDDEVVRSLTSVTGIGEWTAGVFMMFRLQRPDILLAGDLGIRKAA